MLNDLSMAEGGEDILKQQKIQEEENKLLNRLGAWFPPFNPSSRFKLIWDLLQMAFNIFLLFIFPIHLVFEMSLNTLIPPFATNILIPIGLILDIIVNLNTACFLKGVLTLNRRIIFSNYLQHNLKYDLIANLPLLIYCFSYIDGQTGIAYSFIRFSILSYFYKVAQHNQVFKKVEDVFPLSTYSSNIISLIKLLFSIILNLHISALVWLFLAFSEIKNGAVDTWMHAAYINEAGWSTQYIYSYYFSTVTMITVGYGDIFPHTVAEKLVSIVNMMIACGQFAYSVNSIGNIFSQFFKLSNEIKGNMYVINNYMTTKNIRKDLQYQVREYLEYYWKEEKSSNTELELKILNQLSQKLKDTLLMEANKIALRDSPIFSQNFSESIILKTLPLIKEFRCTPEETIYLKGDQDDSSIYFIEKGCVEAFTYQRSPLNKKMKTINSLFTLSTGSFFGSFNFFTGQSREINMRSLEFTTLLKVKRSDFLSLLKDYPDDYEVFCMIRDQVMYSDQMQSIGVKCECCSKSDHLLHLCPLIHFVPQKFPIIRQHAQGHAHHSRVRKEEVGKRQKYRTFLNSDYAFNRLEDYVLDNMEDMRVYFQKYFIEPHHRDSQESINSSEFSDDFGEEEEDDEDLSSLNSKNVQLQEESKEGQQDLQIPSDSHDSIGKINNLDVKFLENQTIFSPSVQLEINPDKQQPQQQPSQKVIPSNPKIVIQSKSISAIESRASKQLADEICKELIGGKKEMNALGIELDGDLKKQIKNSLRNSISQLNLGIQQPHAKNKIQKIKKLMLNQNSNSIKQSILEITQALKLLKQEQQKEKRETKQRSSKSIGGKDQQVKQKLQQKGSFSLSKVANGSHEERDQTLQQLIRQLGAQQQQSMQNQGQHNGNDSIEDQMRNYKFFYPQHNVTYILDHLQEGKKHKKEQQKIQENRLLEAMKDNVMIKKRQRFPPNKPIAFANRPSKNKRLSKNPPNSLLLSSSGKNEQTVNMNTSNTNVKAIQRSSQSFCTSSSSSINSQQLQDFPSIDPSLVVSKSSKKMKKNSQNKTQTMQEVSSKSRQNSFQEDILEGEMGENIVQDIHSSGTGLFIGKKAQFTNDNSILRSAYSSYDQSQDVGLNDSQFKKLNTEFPLNQQLSNLRFLNNTENNTLNSQLPPLPRGDQSFGFIDFLPVLKNQ